MSDVVKIILFSGLSGMTIFFGGLLSHYFGDHVKAGFVKAEIIHLSIAFGGGILLAAVGLLLVPTGMKSLRLMAIILFFLSGTITFFIIDRYISTKGGTMAQLLGMLSDFIPEAITMGAVFSRDYRMGVLLALIISIQNLPESFNAFMDLKTHYTTRKCLIILLLLSFSGIIASLAGYYLLSESPRTVASLMLFSSGGIVYLIFQDIAPMSKLKNNWIPALSASMGFLIGMISVKVLS